MKLCDIIISKLFIFVTGESVAVKAFDKFLTQSVYQLADTCDDLNDMGEMGKLLVDCFDGVRYVIVLASRSKKPGSIADIVPHLKPITENVTKIRGLRLKREFDNHYKAMMEMLTCLSWVTCGAHSQLPAPFVKECIGSSDFWSNRIRKEFKGKDAPYQIAYCDNMKNLLSDLVAYITEHHKTGLTFNPKGVSLAEAVIRLADDPVANAAAAAAEKEGKKTNKKQSAVGASVKAGNVMGLMSELAGRKNADGSSAATGLKKVRICALARALFQYIIIVRAHVSIYFPPDTFRLPKINKPGAKSLRETINRIL
jgi:adenylyl cyclase-associated protein